ncbi:unnamed protein product, partial [Rotaria magnacalcarata]
MQTYVATWAESTNSMASFIPHNNKKNPRIGEKISYRRKQSLDAAAVEAIIQDSHAFNLFRKSGMQHFLSVATPGYRRPNRRTVVKRLKPMYKQHRSYLRKRLSAISDMALSVDMWQSNRRLHFLGYRLGRFIRKEIDKLGIRSKICAITSDNGSDIRSATTHLLKFGIKVSCILHNFNLIVQNGLRLFKIPKNNIAASSNFNNTTNSSKSTVEYVDYSTDYDYDSIVKESQEFDEISNCSKSCSSSEDETDHETTTSSSSSTKSEFSSFDDSSDEDDVHLLPKTFTEEEQLIQAASEDPTILLSKIHLLMKRIRKLVSIINKSSVLNRYINSEIKLKLEIANSQVVEQKKKMKFKGFTLDMRIRWGSSFIMISRFVLYSSIINSLTHDPTAIIGLTSTQCRTLRKLSFSSIDWSILKSVEHVLSRFQQGTKLLSSRRESTLSKSHSVVHAIKTFLTTLDDCALTFENLLKKHLLSVFNFYYEKHVTDEQKVATLVAAFLDPYTYPYLSDDDQNEAEAILLNENLTHRIKSNSKSTPSHSQPI